MEVRNPGELEQQELARIFEKFYRVPRQDRWKHPGTGLGLALVQRLVEQIQGRIRAFSHGGWVCLTLQIPRYLESASGS